MRIFQAIQIFCQMATAQSCVASQELSNETNFVIIGPVVREELRKIRFFSVYMQAVEAKLVSV